jgi:hypothetical protein
MRQPRSILVCTLFISTLSGRAAIAGEHNVHAYGGLGVDQPSGDGVEGKGSGLLLGAEYARSSFDYLRFYGGLQFTSPDRDSCGEFVSPCEVSSKIGFFGAKLRLSAPIPYVAPYFEIGLGGSLGRMVTRVSDKVNAVGSGLMFHVPVGVGLAIGSQHSFELGIALLFHPAQRHVSGGFAVGIGLQF